VKRALNRAMNRSRLGAGRRGSRGVHGRSVALRREDQAVLRRIREAGVNPSRSSARSTRFTQRQLLPFVAELRHA
jgi:hypothetical protein